MKILEEHTKTFNGSPDIDREEILDLLKTI